MKIIRGISQVQENYANPVVAIGVFDGLHRGHQLLIRQAVKRAQALKGTVVVMTFSPHPVHVLRPDIYSPLIVTLSYRLKLLQELGVDVCVVVHFTKRLARLTPEKFIQRYLVDKIKAKEVVVGDDFRFGQDRQGTLDFFHEAAGMHGFSVHAVSTRRGGKKTISSSVIRQLIAEGDLSQAAKLLGRPVSLLGRVVHGDSRGTTLGYPTANINPTNEVLPPSGVYLVGVRVNNCLYRAIANVGRRPSFKRISRVNVEVHLFDFHKNLYGKEIVVEFIQWLRDEKNFQSQENLIEQIKKDEQKAKNYFEKRKSTQKRK